MKNNKRRIMADLLFYIGLAITSVGIGLLNIPAGIISAGISFAISGLISAAGSAREGDG